MKKCAHPYPGDDSAHMRLATLDRKPAGANRIRRGILMRNAPYRAMPHGAARTGNAQERFEGNSDGY
jgi:hypothetical protein